MLRLPQIDCNHSFDHITVFVGARNAPGGYTFATATFTKDQLCRPAISAQLIYPNADATKHGMKQFVNLDDMGRIDSLSDCTSANSYGGTGYSESEGTPPVGARGIRTCVVVEVQNDPDHRVQQITFFLEDPPYQPPWGTAEAASLPNNPGVYNDFGCQSTNGNDNRIGDGSPNPPCTGDIGQNPQAGFVVSGALQTTVTVPVITEGGKRVAKALLEVSSFGGNNYRIRADYRPTPIPCADPNPDTLTVTSDILTVWRKVWIFRDRMQHADLSLMPDTSKVDEMFDDAFLETRVRPELGAVIDYADYLRFRPRVNQPSDCVKTEGDPSPPHGIGAITHVHNEIPSRYGQGTGHPPSPNHWIASHGVAYLAHRRCRDSDGNLIPGVFFQRAQGVMCGSYANVPAEPDHAFVAVEGIIRANDATLVCAESTYDRTLADACLHANPSIPDCISIPVYLSRATIHEFVHSLLPVESDVETNCSPPHTQFQAILDYNCFFRASFGGYVSIGQIMQVRSGTQTNGVPIND
jgi:hypothetical protein